MKTKKMTMAQALVTFLENQYLEVDGKEIPFVKGIFMIPGHGNVVGLGQALSQEAKKLVVMQGKNEQGMALAAMSFSKQMKRKQIMVATSSVGPGGANMVTACACATANNIPLLVLPGDTYACRQPDPVLQQLEQTTSLSITTNDAFKAVCKYWDRIVRPEQLMSAMLNAFRVLTDQGNTGAVCIAMPQDVEGEAYEYPVEFLEKRVWHFDRRPADNTSIEKAVKIIKKSKKPLIIVGGGVRYSEAHDVVKSFAEKYNIPFGETQAGKGAIPYDHKLNLGGIGVTGCSAANEIAKKADLVIGIGTRYTDFTTSSKWLFSEKCEFISINASDFQANKMNGHALVGDAKTTVEALMKALAGYKSSYKNEIEAARTKWDKELNRLANFKYSNKSTWKPIINDKNAKSANKFAKDLDASLTQVEVLYAINQMMGKKDVAVGAAGSLPGDMQRMWQAKDKDTYNMEYGYSTMGYEIAGALGSKIAVGDNADVYAFVGDGSFNMLHSELITACQEHKKIIVCLFDNASYGCINNLQVGHGNETLLTELRYRGKKNLDGDFMDIDYAGIAKAYGCASYKIKNMYDLKQAFNDAKKIKNLPVLFDIKVLPKTMTDGYGSWWRTGDVEVSNNKENVKAYNDMISHLKNARKF